jgi:hypothetical protein
VTAAAFRGMIEYLPCGFTFMGRDIAQYTTKNPIVVHVTRHKKDTKIGMWDFQYGNVVGKSAVHAFQESGDITIEPVLKDTNLGKLFGSVSDDILSLDWSSTSLIVTIVQGALCQGLAWQMGFLISGEADSIADMIRGEAPDCDDGDFDCWAEWAMYMHAAYVAATQLTGPNATRWLLEYIIYHELCDSDDSYLMEEGDVTTTFDALNKATSEWFKTDLHLFETQLYSKDSIE